MWTKGHEADHTATGHVQHSTGFCHTVYIKMPRTTVITSLGADWLYLEVFYSHLMCYTYLFTLTIPYTCEGGTAAEVPVYQPIEFGRMVYQPVKFGRTVCQPASSLVERSTSLQPVEFRRTVHQPIEFGENGLPPR